MSQTFKIFALLHLLNKILLRVSKDRSLMFNLEKVINEKQSPRLNPPLSLTQIRNKIEIDPKINAYKILGPIPGRAAPFWTL